MNRLIKQNEGPGGPRKEESSFKHQIVFTFCLLLLQKKTWHGTHISSETVVGYFEEDIYVIKWLS